jgi:alcohol oxidase
MRTMRGSSLVVISAGALGTPGILERSGIGGKEVLEGVGVKQRIDMPGVGENYQGPSTVDDECMLLLTAFGHAQITLCVGFFIPLTKVHAWFEDVNESDVDRQLLTRVHFISTEPTGFRFLFYLCSCLDGDAPHARKV